MPAVDTAVVAEPTTTPIDLRQDSGPAAAVRRRSVAGRYLLTAVALAVAAWYAARVTSWSEVASTIGAMTRSATALIVVLTVVNLVTYWMVLTAALPGLTLARAASVQLPATALSNVAPAGGAIGTGFTVYRLRDFGHGLRDVAAAMLVNGVLATVAKMVTAAMAVVLLAPSADTAAAAPVAAVALLGLLVVGVVRLLSSGRAALVVSATLQRPIHRVLALFGRRRRVGLVMATARLQRDVGSLVRRRWPRLVAATLVSHVALFALFVAAFRGVGLGAAEVSTAELLGSFGVARVASLIPLTPGGVGLVELSLTASMTASGGEAGAVIAGVAVYRFTTYVVPTLLGLSGLAAWAIAGRGRREPIAGGQGGSPVPLVVDLDGTLLPVTSRSIMLARLLWRRPQALAGYRRRHRADRLASKFDLWEAVGVDVDAVPVRRRLLRRLRAEAAAGRPVYVASGAPDELVSAIVDRLGVFRGGWGSTRRCQLVGEAKGRLLLDRFGPRGFDYIGDAREDLEVWRHARVAVVFHPSRRLRRAVRAVAPRVEVIRRPPGAVVGLAARLLVAVLTQRPRRRERAAPACVSPRWPA